MINDYFAIAILNRPETTQNSKINFAELGLNKNYEIRDLWRHKVIRKGKGKKKKRNGTVLSHETNIIPFEKGNVKSAEMNIVSFSNVKGMKYNIK